ncbi:tRNA (adenosine(37)-N6)-threonylcarbamoyltransferase complex dimerization subunit type 1 TsaB [Cupriavidus gilardii]|uniref:tRNA (adenosine(37)-N6)-threonylcarbamoyltransferase complex dimerization subunit type 1 TsaB n=1 Tax=Cupriavidus gilardii TaxID=82541 RepID=UPI001573FBC2|nr:tRNA (adenosine(37)-N6)-threonylcarbamoyltransferase complex dimerization subunit type 1 TsaB [Cupriavidus gilardii]NSX05025.1 tRNA (adenosine(37)-N6)-threonylcarbamoyltransferase complex dimerization subunit type 1 TsaB [Cupriavidus gilardii]
MSWILAVETSTEWCSVALGRATPTGGLHCLARHEQTGPRSSARVLPAAGELLAEAGIRLADCAAIAFGAGPGSFTGLRTACGIAQGLAFGADLPVVPVNTLMACAERVRGVPGAGLEGEGDPAADVLPSGMPVLVALDARMDEVYAGLFDWDAVRGEWQEAGPMRVIPPEAVPNPAAPFWLAGNGVTVYGERLQVAAQAARTISGAMPHAAAVVAIAQRALARGETVAAADAAPLYLRDKVAQTVAERQAAAAGRASLAATGERQ